MEFVKYSNTCLREQFLDVVILNVLLHTVFYLYILLCPPISLLRPSTYLFDDVRRELTLVENYQIVISELHF